MFFFFWFFVLINLCSCLGSQVVEINDDGKLKFTCLGPDLIEGDQKPQYTVPPNIWFGSFPTKDFHFPHNGTLLRAEPRDSENHFSLVGCTCAPGFQFEDFELAKRSHLMSLFPQHELLITMLSYPEWWGVLLLIEDILYVVFLLQNLTYEPCEVVTVLFDFTFELSFFVFFQVVDWSKKVLHSKTILSYL